MPTIGPDSVLLGFTVTTGPVSITMTARIESTVLYPPVLSTGGVALFVPTIPSGAQVRAPSLVVGNAQISLPTISSTVLHPPVLRYNQSISTPTWSVSTRLFAFRISGYIPDFPSVIIPPPPKPSVLVGNQRTNPKYIVGSTR
jgi:hypothetical protein